MKLTERVKLWDKYCGPVNQDAIKVQFLKKIHRQNPPFRLKVKHPREHAIKVRTASLYFVIVVFPILQMLCITFKATTN